MKSKTTSITKKKILLIKNSYNDKGFNQNNSFDDFLDMSNQKNNNNFDNLAKVQTTSNQEIKAKNANISNKINNLLNQDNIEQFNSSQEKSLKSYLQEFLQILKSISYINILPTMPKDVSEKFNKLKLLAQEVIIDIKENRFVNKTDVDLKINKFLSLKNHILELLNFSFYKPLFASFDLQLLKQFIDESYFNLPDYIKNSNYILAEETNLDKYLHHYIINKFNLALNNDKIYLLEFGLCLYVSQNSGFASYFIDENMKIFKVNVVKFVAKNYIKLICANNLIIKIKISEDNLQMVVKYKHKDRTGQIIEYANKHIKILYQNKPSNFIYIEYKYDENDNSFENISVIFPYFDNYNNVLPWFNVVIDPKTFHVISCLGIFLCEKFIKIPKFDALLKYKF